MASRFTDFDEEERLKLEAEILQNEKLGLTVEDRRQALERSKRWCGLLNAISYFMIFWSLIFPWPYKAHMVLLVLLPVVAIMTPFIHKGKMLFYSKEPRGYPSLLPAFTLPSVALFWRAYVDWNWRLINYVDIAIPVIIGGTLIALVSLGARKSIAKFQDHVLLLLVGMGLSYGASVNANCLLDLPPSAKLRVLPILGLVGNGDFPSDDKTPFDEFRVTIIEKKGESKSYISHFLKVTEWADQPKGNRVLVSREDFIRAEVGSTAIVKSWSGALGARWYTASVPPPEQGEDRKDEKPDQSSLDG